METQKILNLLNDSSSEEFKFATKKWYVIDSQTTKGKYKQDDTIKFETKTIKPSPCDYSDFSYRKLQTMMQMLRLRIVHHFLHVKQ